jgi:hypothetical protein
MTCEYLRGSGTPVVVAAQSAATELSEALESHKRHDTARHMQVYKYTNTYPIHHVPSLLDQHHYRPAASSQHVIRSLCLEYNAA